MTTNFVLIGSLWPARRIASRAIGSGHARHLEHDAARLDDRDPVVRRALARAHADLGRLLRDRLVREDPDPDTATALDVMGHGAARGLDLAAGEPADLLGHEAEVAEADRRAALGQAGAASALDLAVLDPLGHQHRQASSFGRLRASLPAGLAGPRGSGAFAARAPWPRPQRVPRLGEGLASAVGAVGLGGRGLLDDFSAASWRPRRLGRGIRDGTCRRHLGCRDRPRARPRPSRRGLPPRHRHRRLDLGA